MVISHKYKFIFIKNTKCAGTSTEVFLSSVCPESDIFTPIFPASEHHIPRNYMGFCNPFPELISHWRADKRGTTKRGFSSDLKHTARRLVAGIKYSNHMSARAIKSKLPKNIWRDYYKFCIERNPWDKTVSVYHMVKVRSQNNALEFENFLARRKFPSDFSKYTDENGEVLVN